MTTNSWGYTTTRRGAISLGPAEPPPWIDWDGQVNTGERRIDKHDSGCSRPTMIAPAPWKPDAPVIASCLECGAARRIIPDHPAGGAQA